MNKHTLSRGNLRLLELFDIFLVFLKIGVMSFGSGTSEVMFEMIVEKQKWLSIDEFQDQMAIAGMLPGPFHINLAIACGYKYAGFHGSIVGALGFVLPGFLFAVLLALSIRSDFVVNFLSTHLNIISGILLAVAGLLLSIILKLGRQVVGNLYLWAFVILLSLMIVLFKVSLVLVLLLSGVTVMVVSGMGDNKKGHNKC